MKIAGYFTIFISMIVILDYSIDMTDCADNRDNLRYPSTPSRGKNMNPSGSSEQKMKETTLETEEEVNRNRKKPKRKYKEGLNDQLLHIVFNNYVGGAPYWQRIVQICCYQNLIPPRTRKPLYRIQSQYTSLIREIISRLVMLGNMKMSKRQKTDLLRIYYQTRNGETAEHPNRIQAKWQLEYHESRVSADDLMVATEKLLPSENKETLKSKDKITEKRKMSDASGSSHNTVYGEPEHQPPYFEFLPEYQSTPRSSSLHGYHDDTLNASSSSYLGSEQTPPDLELSLSPIHNPTIR